MIALKLALIALSVGLSSWAARHFGPFVGGAIGGLPVIAGPIIGFVGWPLPAEEAQPLARAVVACLPAAVAHLLVFVHLSHRRGGWRAAILVANAAFMAIAWALLRWPLAPPAAVAFAFLAPVAGLALLPSGSGGRAPERHAEPLQTSGSSPAGFGAVEMALRVGAALALAGAVFFAAARFSPEVSGALLAVPVTGNVLPCFLAARYGRPVTVSFIAGFMKSLLAFAAFFVVLALALPAWPFPRAYAAAWAGAFVVAAATTVQTRWRRRRIR